ncbi:hypothetical protein SBA2_30092 [Acidobacteriia bacterium SbA2]|nr:hypothetical protein SBA2_30092 [Acidobacteriia bacterium SbA2]
MFQNRPAEERLLNAAQDPRLPPELSAPQGLNMSSRGQRPRKRRPAHPLSPLPAGGERGAEGGVWGRVRAFHPSADGLLNLLPSGERGLARSRLALLQAGTEGFEAAPRASTTPDPSLCKEGSRGLPSSDEEGLGVVPPSPPQRLSSSLHERL